MAGPRRPSDDESPRELENFEVGNVQVSVHERLVKDGKQQFFVQLSQTIVRPDGSETSQRFVCDLTQFRDASLRADDIAREFDHRNEPAPGRQAVQRRVLDTFDVGNIQVSVHERIGKKKEQQFYVQLSQKVMQPDGSELAQRFVCHLMGPINDLESVSINKTAARLVAGRSTA
jgi:hypothetical protein